MATSKSKAFHRFKPVGYWELVSQILGKDESSWGDEDSVSNIIYGATAEFMDRWQRDDDATEIGLADVENAIRQAIEDNVNKSLAEHRMYAVAAAIEESLAQAPDTPVPSTIEQNPKRLTITIEVASHPMMSLWARSVEGQGVVAWDSSLRITDITNAQHLITILDNYAEVYGTKSLRRRYENYMDGFEPNTGNYSDLYQIALKANRLWRKKK